MRQAILGALSMSNRFAKARATGLRALGEGFICALALGAATAAPGAAQKIPTVFRLGPYGEFTSKPWLDPGVGFRSLLSIASVGELRLDVGVRRPESTPSAGPRVGMLAGTVHYNAFGGYPDRQWGAFLGYQHFFGAERGHEWLAGITTATSHARGEHVQYELGIGPRIARGRPTHWVGRFKIIVIRLPPLLRKVPQPPPLTLVVDSMDAGGVPSTFHWMGGRGMNVDRMCRFYFIQMSTTPLLVYRPECDSTGLPTLNQQASARRAKHSALSCGMKDAEPIIHGHINWTVVSRTGRLRWHGFNSGPNADHDFNLLLDAPDMMTRGNIRANRRERGLRDDPLRDSLIELEFHAGETTAHFEAEYGGELWSPLIALPQLRAHTRPYDIQDSSANDLFYDRLAVVTGLLGLDGEHDFHTELHPVLGLAADVSHKLADRSSEAWLVFIRNMGNEGECSTGQLPWMPRDSSSNRYVLELPWKNGADSVSVEADSSTFGFIARRLVTLQVQVDRSRAIRLVAELPRPTSTDSLGIVYGTLRLRWYGRGLPLVNPTATAAPTIERQPMQQDRDKHGVDSLNTGTFPPTRPLCFTVGAAGPVDRRPPPFLRPQTVLHDRPTVPRPTQLDSCATVRSAAAPQ